MYLRFVIYSKVSLSIRNRDDLFTDGNRFSLSIYLTNSRYTNQFILKRSVKLWIIFVFKP